MYVYFELKQIEGELKILANKEEKPKYTTARDYPSALEYWQSKHQIIPFYSKDEEDKVYEFVVENQLTHLLNVRFEKAISEGVQIDCIEVKDGITDFMPKKAFFKSPEKETKQRLYTEDEMKGFIDYVAGIYKPISQSGVIIYWTDSYNNKNAPKLSTNDLLTDFINKLNK